MNFYGHLVTASWQSAEPLFALGSMLPDFVTMVGLRLPEPDDGKLAEGIEFHHACDRVFHRLERFRLQESWTREHMLEHGLRRGPARGVAHVGVELSLDGALVDSPEGHVLYLAALEAAQEESFAWKEPEGAERFALLMERLSAIGIPVGYSDPDIVADRLVRIMDPRPLLRLTDEETPILRHAIVDVHQRVDDEAPQLMRELRAALG